MKIMAIVDRHGLPLSAASMHSFVVLIALRQHMPLRTRVENPQDRFEHMLWLSMIAAVGLDWHPIRSRYG
jgi:hypothetical protein